MAQQHQDDAAVQELEQALSSYHAGGSGGGGRAMGMAAAAGGAGGGGAAGAAAGQQVNICEIWGRIRSVVMAGISVLKMLPFGWAKGLANALQELSNALNLMCGAGGA